ncbi:hypothetical protein H7A76_30680 [Pseudomonas sp. MSSRFD41]|uniref:pyocin knob domain-containing protein n=1 Tax=Pseudomonas sp. MSSRFD41 TaxID=1310370 RepID=UPI00163A7865|nr:pyocin knob domain-containing protein [Pseudomonas sp. MSSRFD41]MBC2659822.1 hypothetical protein [Pseudomonas sp. MSSRFD41]
MATNDFLPFGIAAGANVMSQADYAVLASRANGFSSGTAVSAQLNKAWRQSSVMSSVLAQYISDNATVDVLDNGSTAPILTNLATAISNAAKNAGTSWVKITGKPTTLSGYGITDAMNKYAGGIESLSVVLASDLNSVPSTGMYRFNPSTTNNPSGATFGTVIHISYNQPTLNWTQQAVSTTDSRSWFRSSANGSVQPWQELWSSANFNPNNFQNTVGIQGAYKNLSGSASGTSASAVFSADEIVIENSSNQYQTLRGVSISPSLASSGANGLDTGTSTSNTWYSVWVIWNGTNIAGLFSLSATNPTLPSGYTHRARIGWVRTDGTANKYPLSFIQYGRVVQYKVASGSNLTSLPAVASGTAGDINTPTWVAISMAQYVPTTASRVSVTLSIPAATSAALMVAPNTSYGAYNSSTNPPPVGLSASGQLLPSPSMGVISLESTSIYWASSTAQSRLYVGGWEDNL